MAFVAKVLADGQLSNSKTTLYSAPVGTTTYVKFSSFFNTGANAETVVVYANPGGTSRIIGRVLLSPNEQARVIDKDEGLIVEASGLIEGTSTNSAVVDYVVCGVEES